MRRDRWRVRIPRRVPGLTVGIGACDTEEEWSGE